MRTFSIIQHTMTLRFANTAGRQQTLDFSEDPDDSSNVRLRITPPVDPADGPVPDAEALEFTFDRNGRVRSHRSWPMQYPAWDQRSPEDIERVLAEMNKTAADAEKPDELEALSMPVKKGKPK